MKPLLFIIAPNMNTAEMVSQMLFKRRDEVALLSSENSDQGMRGRAGENVVLVNGAALPISALHRQPPHNVMHLTLP